MKKIKLVLSIRSLDIGGAERQFIELVKHIDKTKFDILACSMYGGEMERALQSISNIQYINLYKKGRYDFFDFYRRYKKILKDFAPDVIYSFLGEMNLFSYWCKPKKSKLIWGFRASNMNLKKYGKLSQILFWLQKIYSKKVDKIIANSNASVSFHKDSGFDMSRAVVAYNGIDTKKFQKNSISREKLRKKYGLKDYDIVIGIVARIDYMKGYIVFSGVAKKLLEKYDDLYFVSIGSGDKGIKRECEAILDNFSDTKFLWLGKQTEVERFYNMFDISSSSSFGEGFSNSIAEAMSCEIPCVVTDVGDSKIVVGDCGEVVKPNDTESLYNGINNILNKNLEKFGKCSRERIVKNFSIETMVKKTEKEILKCVE